MNIWEDVYGKHKEKKAPEAVASETPSAPEKVEKAGGEIKVKEIKFMETPIVENPKKLAKKPEKK